MFCRCAHGGSGISDSLQKNCQSQRKNEIQYASFALAITEKSPPCTILMRAGAHTHTHTHTHVIETEIMVNWSDIDVPRERAIRNSLLRLWSLADLPSKSLFLSTCRRNYRAPLNCIGGIRERTKSRAGTRRSGLTKETR